MCSGDETTQVFHWPALGSTGMVPSAGVSYELEQAALNKVTKTSMRATLLGPEPGLGWTVDLTDVANKGYMWREVSRWARHTPAG